MDGEVEAGAGGDVVNYILSGLLAIYLIGVVVIFAIHTQTPVTLGLAVLRSVAWPIWVTTGHPRGVPLRMD